MNKTVHKDDTYPEPEVEARREATLKTLLSTPPKPLDTSKGKGKESQSKLRSAWFRLSTLIQFSRARGRSKLVCILIAQEFGLLSKLESTN
tara:strand:+ start:118 stop:390 length:273 start_codon:yes stop_codon:yes gene_type:complete